MTATGQDVEQDVEVCGQLDGIAARIDYYQQAAITFWRAGRHAAGTLERTGRL